jgi:glycosyltransferase involved in cell wall biosynthesis
MKIIWAIPTFDNPETGGEKVFKRLAELLESRGALLIKTYQENKERSGIVRQIVNNFRSFKILIRQDKLAPIFQNVFNRHQYLLANTLMHFLLKRKIILFINEICETSQLSYLRKWYHWLINYITFKSTSLIVVNSRFTGNWVCRFGDFERNLFLMYPVIDLRTKNSRRLKELQNGPAYILCVGNIRQNKGQIHLLKAMEYIQQDFKITFVGLAKERDYMERLRGYVTEKGMCDKVYFAGFLSGAQLAREYQKADIFVLPTLKEGFGMAVLEAMSYGLPVVASNVGAVCEVIEDRINGLLVEPESPESLSSAIHEILEKPSLKKQLQKNATERLAHFKTIEQQFDRFYERIIRAIAY